MLERVLDLGEEPRLVQELRRAQPLEAGVQGFLGAVHRAEHGLGDVPSDDRGRLQDVLVLGGELVDAPGDDGAHRRRDAEGGGHPGERVPAALPGEDAVRGRHGHATPWRKNGLPCARASSIRRSGAISRALAEEGVEEQPCGVGGEGLQPELLGVAAGAPQLVFGPVAHERRIGAIGTASTMVSSSVWLSASTQCRSSMTTRTGRCRLSPIRSCCTASMVCRRRSSGSSRCQRTSSTGAPTSAWSAVRYTASAG